jgi:hypothetical protein
MNKTIGVVLSLFILTSCSVSNLIPNKFDNAEYSSLVRLGVIAENTKACDVDYINVAWFESAFLDKYAEHTMNETNQRIYTKINELVEELRNREDPSPAYCRIKWGNISSIVEEALQVSGSRMK